MERVGEEEVIRFLKKSGKATLDEVSSALKIPKYGPNSAYEILYSLKSKNIVERRGNAWALTEKAQPQTNVFGERDSAESDKGLEKLARTIKEAVMGQQTLVDLTTVKENMKGKEAEPVEQRPKALIGLKTGTFLDRLFLGLDGKPLGGIPSSGQLALIGPLGAGKSLLASEIALKVSYERKTLFVVLNDVWESNRAFDLRSRLRIRSAALQLDWDYLSRNLRVLNPPHVDEEFLDEYERIISGGEVGLALLDSMNQVERQNIHGYEEPSVDLADMVSINRAHGVTGIFVMHSGLNCGEPAQNMISSRSLWLMDCIISMMPAQLTAPSLGANVGGIRGIERLRVVQILKCRLCGFDGRGILVGITSKGLIKPLELEGFEG